MELYVRSQNKERLERFNSAQISSATILGKEEYYILINLSVFGTYETKERVIEVIDEIDQILQTRHCYGTDYVDANMVFEIPKE